MGGGWYLIHAQPLKHAGEMKTLTARSTQRYAETSRAAAASDESQTQP